MPTLPGLMPDESATVVVSDGSADNGVFGQAGLDVRWTDNAIVNRDGADLAVFESDRAERFSVSLFDPMAGAFTAPRSFDPLATRFYNRCGFPLNIAQVDLSDFGVLRKAVVTMLRLDNLGAPGCCEGADIADVRAINSAVPPPLFVRADIGVAKLNLDSQGVLRLKPLSTSILEAVSVDSATIRMGDPELPGLAPPRLDTRCRSRRTP
jgi:hypothetical protein